MVRKPEQRVVPIPPEAYKRPRLWDEVLAPLAEPAAARTTPPLDRSLDSPFRGKLNRVRTDGERRLNAANIFCDLLIDARILPAIERRDLQSFLDGEEGQFRQFMERDRRTGKADELRVVDKIFQEALEIVVDHYGAGIYDGVLARASQFGGFVVERAVVAIEEEVGVPKDLPSAS